MTEQEMEKLAKGKDELLKILDDYKKTKDLLNEQKWDELQSHISKIKVEHFMEACIHNSTHPNSPRTVEENARNCLLFLENLLVEKAGYLGIDLRQL